MQQIHSKMSSNRNSEKSQLNRSNNSKQVSREDSLINYDLLVMSNSKNFIAEKRKRGKSGFQKKITDVGNLS